MEAFTLTQAERQVSELQDNGHFEMMVRLSWQHGLPLALVLAVCSRETNCRNILGDYRDGEPHGVGLMQVDIQHGLARRMRDDGLWTREPDKLVDYACGLLWDLRQRVEAIEPGLDEGSALRMAAAAYNCGWERMMAGHERGNCDRYTTGQDYGADVLRRKAVFEDAIGGMTLPENS